MPMPAAVPNLPPELQSSVARQLERGTSFRTISTWLKNQGFSVGKSSIQRWYNGYADANPTPTPEDPPIGKDTLRIQLELPLD